MSDRLEIIKIPDRNYTVDDVRWLITEVERLRAIRIADLNELAEGFELTSRSSVDGAVFRACARIVQSKITEIELGTING